MQVTLPNDLSYALMIRLKCENLKSVMQFILSQECLSAVWFCGKFGSGNSDCFYLFIFKLLICHNLCCLLILHSNENYSIFI
jgi:hypothetical protein